MVDSWGHVLVWHLIVSGCPAFPRGGLRLPSGRLSGRRVIAGRAPVCGGNPFPGAEKWLGLARAAVVRRWGAWAGRVGVPAMVRRVALFAAVASVLGAADAPLLPTNSGTSWVYKGSIRWLGNGSNVQVRSQQITWTMDVIRVLGRDRHVAVVEVQGFIFDLLAYPRERRNYVVLTIEGHELYVIQPERIQANPSKVEPQLSDLLIRLPAMAGDKVGADGWVVTAVRNVNLTHVRNAPAGTPTEYEIRQERPEGYTVLRFVPGLGFTAFAFAQHKSKTGADMRLIEFRPK